MSRAFQAIPLAAVALLGLALTSASMQRAHAEATWEFQKLVDNLTVAPDSGGLPFWSLNSPVIEGEHVYFYGATILNSTVTRGIYQLDLASNAITRLARQGDPSPDGTAYGSLQTAISVHGENIVYSDANAIYVKGPAGTATIVRRGDAMPGGGTFNSFSDGFAIEGTNVAFSAQAAGPPYPTPSGVYVRRGFNAPLETIADWNTTIPGTVDTKFNGRFYYLIAHQGTFYFTGVNDNTATAGIYAWSNGVLSRVVDSLTTVPGQGFGYFSSFKQIAADDGNLNFMGQYGGGQGIYKRLGAGAFEPVADSQTTLPEPPTALTAFTAVDMDGQAVVFVGSAGYRTGGFYSDAGGDLHQVMSYTNRFMEGRQANSLLIRVNHCFDANRFVYHADYAYETNLPPGGASSAIWMATVNASPPPKTGLLLRVE